MAESAASRAALRRALEAREPAINVLAEDFLGLEIVIDLVAADAEGRLVLGLLAEPGREVEAVGLALAQLAFHAPRIRDWKKLAPDLPLSPDAPPRAVVATRTPAALARAAAEATGGQVGLIEIAASPERSASGSDRATQGQASRRPRSRFRTGLRDEDLGLLPTGAPRATGPTSRRRPRTSS